MASISGAVTRTSPSSRASAPVVAAAKLPISLLHALGMGEHVLGDLAAEQGLAAAVEQVRPQRRFSAAARRRRPWCG